MLTLLSVLMTAATMSVGAKIAPIDIHEVIANSDAIFYVKPTTDPFKARVVSVIASKSKARPTEVELFHNPEYRNGRLENLSGSVTNPAILFLKRPTDGTGKWRFWSYSPAGMLNLVDGAAECHEKLGDKPTRYIVDFDFIFPASLHLAKRDRVTEPEIARTINRLARSIWAH